MKANAAEAYPGKTESSIKTAKIDVAVEMLQSGRLMINWGDHDFVFFVDHKGNPKVKRIDENTRWKIYKGDDGHVVVEMLDDDTGDIG